MGDHSPWRRLVALPLPGWLVCRMRIGIGCCTVRRADGVRRTAQALTPATACNPMPMSKTWRERILRAMKAGATVVVEVAVWARGDRQRVYLCPCMPGSVWLCGVCGDKLVLSKLRDHCSCGATVARVRRMIDVEMAQAIERQMLAAWERSREGRRARL